MRTLLLLCAAALCTLNAGGQTIQVSTSSAPVDLLTINDVDFVNSTTPKWLFTIDMKLSPPGSAVQAIMTVRGSIKLTTGESFPEALFLETKPFTINGSRSLTNLDLRGSDFRATYITDQVAKKRLQEVALPSSRLPAGTYLFAIEVRPVAAGQPGRGTIRYVLTNPSTVELLFPFDGDQAVSQFPLFQWLYDGTQARISIFEKLPGQSSLEEAASGVPHLVQDVSTNSFQYPSAGARALVPGKTYVWLVEGRVRTTGGVDSPIRSVLRSFSVAATGGIGSSESLLDQLERALGPTYKAVFDRIRANGLTASGVFSLDDAPASAAEVLRLINQLRSAPESVQSVRLN